MRGLFSGFVDELKKLAILEELGPPLSPENPQPGEQRKNVMYWGGPKTSSRSTSKTNRPAWAYEERAPQ